MRWQRKKPLWPIAAALGLLFILVLAAPYYWQSGKLSSQQKPSTASTKRLLLDSQALAANATSAPQEPLPIQREFDFETLLEVRNKLLELIDQLPAEELSPTASRSPAQVRISSDNDRLAMLPPRRAARRRATRRSPRQPEIQEANNFATVLLEAARNPKPAISARPTSPRMAMRSTEPKTVEPAPVAQPQLLPPTMPIALPPAEQPQPLPAPRVPAPLRHQPRALVDQLEKFKPHSPGAFWAQQVLRHLRHLTDDVSGERMPAGDVLEELEQLYTSGRQQAEDSTKPAVHNHWLQSVHALGRRLVLWRLLVNPSQPKIIESPTASTTVLPVLNEVVQVLDQEKNGDDWREYLMLDRLAAATSEGMGSPALTRAKLAQEVLSRMEDPQLTAAQVEFLNTTPLLELHAILQPWAAGKVNLETLAALIERYESGSETRYAAVISQLQQRLKWSGQPQLQTLATQLDKHYRGANLRIAISEDLMNRMIPQQKPIVSPVRDRIAGAKVRGRARTTTQLQVRLKPSPDAWLVSLEAKGKVYSDTRSDTWPARIRNAAKMQYEAHKDVRLNAEGVHVSQAQATAKGRNDLLGVDSQFDPVPILGTLFRDMARQKHKKSRPVALTQAKAKVIRQAKQRMDSGLEEKLESLEQRFRDKVLGPLEQLSLLAEPLDMYTTQDRAVMQLRLANHDQLAAHTDRPLAPSDSVLSLQMHETSFNNAMRGLGLDGRRMTMIELFEFISQRTGRQEAAPPEDMPRKAVIQFANRDAVQVRCQGDRLELILSVVELAHRFDKIKNFQIHVHFRPELEGLNVKLVRDGTLQFSGRRLKTGPRVVLHSVIGKLITKDQQFDLFKGKLQEDPRFNGLMVTQLVIEDGWVGLALGPAHPRRTAWRGVTPQVLSTPFLR